MAINVEGPGTTAKGVPVGKVTKGDGVGKWGARIGFRNATGVQWKDLHIEIRTKPHADGSKPSVTVTPLTS
jgi:hypothetical protein